MYTISKTPIIILSSKRTGSTALLHDIILQMSRQGTVVKKFIEPESLDDIKELLTAIDQNKNFALKVHAYDLLKYPLKVRNIILSHNCFLIRIRRKSLVDQITSHYIANQRNIWSYTNSTIYDNSVKEIDPIRIKNSIDVISIYNQAIDTYPIKFDLDLYYEELEFLNNAFIKTPKPENYNYITQYIKGKLCHNVF
jgi:hypothetical protein